MNDGVPLREVLKLAPLEQARIVAGVAGLDRRVRYVNVMEVPDILAWVKPDQLLLTTAYPLRDKRAALESLVPRLAQRGLAGLAIKPARYLDQIPPAMLEAADALAFPVIQLPLETSFDDVINAVLGVILNVQALRLEQSATIHRRFTQIALAGGGLREIALALSELVAHPVGIVRPDGSLLARSPDFGEQGGSVDPLLGRHSPRQPRLGYSLGAFSHSAGKGIGGREPNALKLSVSPLDAAEGDFGPRWQRFEG